MSNKTFFITTAIDYTNAAPHIGHAYEKVLADVIARYHRLCGTPTLFLTGVDQHGQKVQQSAERENLSSQEFATQVTRHFLDLWEQLDIQYDQWAATTDPRHTACVQKILTQLHDQGLLYKAAHKGFYSIRQEQFLTDKERDASGNFGPEWGEVVEIEEENWYFKLTDYREWLLGFLKKRPQFVTPAFRSQELLHAVEKFTNDLCISRPKTRLAWGIEFPFDRDYVTYVWFDALINYLSFSGYLAEPGANLPKFEDWWPAQTHVIGKDILIPAHGVYWPIMLHAMGFEDDQIPNLLVHGWWNISGSKISKSLGNVIDPKLLAEKYGTSALRYYLMRDISTGQDADFSEDRLHTRYTTELANDLGNLLNRSLNMVSRYHESVLHASETSSPAIESLDAVVTENLAQYHATMQKFEIHHALEAVWKIVIASNGLVEASAPWKLAKDPAEAEHLKAVLYHLCEKLRKISLLITPVMPAAAAQIQEQLNWTPASEQDLETLWSATLPDGHTLGKPQPIFPRLELPDSDAATETNA